MSDDKLKRGSQDRTRINIHEDFEVRYWSKELGITPDELKGMVQQLGTSAKCEGKAARINEEKAKSGRQYMPLAAC